MIKTLVLFLSSSLVFLACGSNDTAAEGHAEELPPAVNCSSYQPVPKFAEVTAFQNVCTNCHSSTKVGSARYGAPAEINFDEYASASEHAEQAAIEVNVGAMPPAFADASLTAGEKTTLFGWAMCGAPQ